MYRDNSLLPSEAVRLLALGLLADQPLAYDRLARDVRHFTGCIAGPSLELVAAPLELLKIEGLLSAAGGAGDAELRITPEGREELQRLLSSSVRAPSNEMNKLIIAIKMRLLHLLSVAERRLQLEMLMEISEREVARLQDLREHHRDAGGHLPSWLEQEIRQAGERLRWFEEQLAAAGDREGEKP